MKEQDGNPKSQLSLSPQRVVAAQRKNAISECITQSLIESKVGAIGLAVLVSTHMEYCLRLRLGKQKLSLCTRKETRM